MAIDDELMYRQKLDRGDTKREEILDHRVAAEAEICAAEILGDVGMQLRHSLHMAFVDHRAIPGNVERPVILPGERGIDDDGLWHAAGAVVGIGLEVFVLAADLVGEQCVAPLDCPRDRLRIRIDQQLGWIEAQPVMRFVWAVHAVSVELSRSNVRQIAVEHMVGTLTQTDRVQLRVVALMREEAQVDGSRVLGEDREVDALSVPRCAEGIRMSWPYTHARFSAGGEAQQARLSSRTERGDSQR